MIWFKKLRKWILFFTPLRVAFLFKYELMQSPRQLVSLLTLFETTRDVPGDVFEVGVGYGHTTVILNKLMDEQGSDKGYHAIDTFAGFEKNDVQFEREHRSKIDEDYSAFQVNAKAWFDKTMEINEIRRVRSYQVDAATFVFTGPVSFCLLDVDIYLPTKAVLKQIWPRLSQGGIIVVDDCREKNHFDGALQAYEEFASEHGLMTDIRFGQGILRKN